jgi:catechol 2,3-dioxygenase-like lactoylglutathione lyase family enzyme
LIIMLGRFLEISVTTSAILESLTFYEALGFQQIAVGEVWTHPYAVVTDGRLVLGLHERRAPELSLTYVQPDLLLHLPRLRDQGITFEDEHISADTFHHAAFKDPHGLTVNILEARTFSPAETSGNIESMCGYFTELGIATRDFEQARRFWEPLGFVAMEPSEHGVPHMSLTSDRLNLGFLRTRALRKPVLVFEDENMAARLATLRERGFALSDEIPDAYDPDMNAVLETPEGTKLLLLQAAE